MNDYAALVVVIAVITIACWLARLPVWRKCRCGRQYCTGCNARRGN